MKKFNISIKDPSHLIIEIFGGDNNLTNYIDKDLEEFAKGNQGNFSMIALCDYLDKGASVIEYHPKVGFQVLEEWGEIDTGDPVILKEFIARALLTYPNCPFIALGFWDHGSGVFDEYDPYEVSLKKRLHNLPRKNKAKFRNARKLFLSRTPMNDRAMLGDDTNGGVLTNYEAHLVVQEAIKAAGHNRKLNMIFSDTCLNGMIEVACQFHDLCETVVGSEDLEPAEGWDYYEFLNLMSKNVPTSSQAWAEQTIQGFELGYQNRPRLFPCTLAAFDTSKSKNLIKAIKKLITKIDALGKRTFDTLDRVIRREVQAFDVYDTYDIKDLALKFGNRTSNKELKLICKEVIKAFDNACIKNTSLGPNVKNAYGLAIWFPRNRHQLDLVKQTYSKLKFEELTGWATFIEKYYC